MEHATGFQELLERAQGSDPKAVEELLGLLRPFLERVAQGYAASGQGVQSTADLVQEAWLRAWQKLSQFEPGATDDETRAKFHAWVGEIVHNLGINLRRSQQAKKRQPAGAPILPIATHEVGSGGNSGVVAVGSDPTPSAVVNATEELRLIQQAIDGLEDSLDRSLLHLLFFEELPLSETARRLDLTYEQARYRYQGLLKKLERKLGGLL